MVLITHIGANMRSPENKYSNNRPVETIIDHNDEQSVERATRTYIEGLVNFLFLPNVEEAEEFAKLADENVKRTFKQRFMSVIPLVNEIIIDINGRAAIIVSEEYRHLINNEAEQWRRPGDPKKLEFGVRACVDAGVSREALSGSEGHMGRTLAGDDPLFYDDIRRKFALRASTLSKRIIHENRMGTRVMLEILAEHTGCGRRGQMIANLGRENNDVSHLYDLIFNNIFALVSEFPADDPGLVLQLLHDISTAWEKGEMTKDGGVWSGVLVKLAQRQAYKNIKTENTDLVPVVPIEVYDKTNGDVLVGLDSLAALTHKQVLFGGGYTSDVVSKLVEDGIVFSMVDWINTNLNYFQKTLNVGLGEKQFEDLQHDWLNVKELMIGVTGQLWELYDAEGSESQPIKDMASMFLKLSLRPVQGDLYRVDDNSNIDGITSDFIKRRLIHQLFRAFSYAWVLDTPTRGNVPGMEHIETHAATGESSVLGIKIHLPLGQGDMQLATSNEILTAYSVLMHSEPGKTGSPVVLMMKQDTDRQKDMPLTTEETRGAMQDIQTFLELWPYIVVGDIIPIIAIRDKSTGGVGRLALSPVLAYIDLLALRAAGDLPELVPANNSKGELVYVPAQLILNAGTEFLDLNKFRKEVKKIADTFSNPITQEKFSK